MKPNIESKKSEHPAKGNPPHKKRFRIEKLEERIAPKKGGNGTNNCGSFDSSISGSSNGGSIY